MRLFYSKGLNPQLVGYKYTSYFFDTYKSQSQNKVFVLLWQQHYYFHGGCQANKDYRNSWSMLISPKFFYTHGFRKSRDIDVEQLWSSDNLSILPTKSLPTTISKKIVHNIDMLQFIDIFIIKELTLLLLMRGSKCSEYYVLIVLFIFR